VRGLDIFEAIMMTLVNILDNDPLFRRVGCLYCLLSGCVCSQDGRVSSRWVRANDVKWFSAGFLLLLDQISSSKLNKMTSLMSVSKYQNITIGMMKHVRYFNIVELA
jgi:hypothetical protein